MWVRTLPQIPLHALVLIVLEEADVQRRGRAGWDWLPVFDELVHIGWRGEHRLRRAIALDIRFAEERKAGAAFLILKVPVVPTLVLLGPTRLPSVDIRLVDPLLVCIGGALAVEEKPLPPPPDHVGPETGLLSHDLLRDVELFCRIVTEETSTPSLTGSLGIVPGLRRVSVAVARLPLARVRQEGPRRASRCLWQRTTRGSTAHSDIIIVGAGSCAPPRVVAHAEGHL
mmetsp:Transcript_45427/g.92830  ORF Transcript_45427/g.92830 Transcript_45427/m.92830 type:complete len:228 (+) Transcript_45427:1673-2356(+)